MKSVQFDRRGRSERMHFDLSVKAEALAYRLNAGLEKPRRKNEEPVRGRFIGITGE